MHICAKTDLNWIFVSNKISSNYYSCYYWCTVTFPPWGVGDMGGGGGELIVFLCVCRIVLPFWMMAIVFGLVFSLNI